MGSSNSKTPQEYQFQGQDKNILEFAKTIWSRVIEGDTCEEESQNVWNLCIQGKSRVVHEAFARVLQENASQMLETEYRNTSLVFIKIGYDVNIITHGYQTFVPLVVLRNHYSKLCMRHVNLAHDWEESNLTL